MAYFVTLKLCLHKLSAKTAIFPFLAKLVLNTELSQSNFGLIIIHILVFICPKCSCIYVSFGISFNNPFRPIVLLFVERQFLHVSNFYSEKDVAS